MTSCLHAATVARTLTSAGHTHSEGRRAAWVPGFRVQQASPRTVRLHHDGPDEHPHLDQYAATLRRLGYHATVERRRDRRPALRVTRP